MNRAHLKPLIQHRLQQAHGVARVVLLAPVLYASRICRKCSRALREAWERLDAFVQDELQ